MDLQKMIQENAENTRKYRFYTALGYSPKAAQVLSVLSYGSRNLSVIARQFDPENVLEGLYIFLRDSQYSSPRSAIENYYYDQADQFFEDSTPEDSVTISCLREQVEEILDTLAPREKKVLELRLGIADGKTRTLEEVGQEFNVTRERIRQIEAKALRKLRHPSRSKKLKDFLDGPEEPVSEFYTCPPNAVKCEHFEPETDEYEPIEEKSAKSVFTEPASTFRMTTNTASMGIVMNQLRSGRPVDLSQVRIEELLNYFDYQEEIPTEEKFSISTELLPKGKDKSLLYVHVQGWEERKTHQNIVLLLDVSGSMSGNSEVTQEAVAAIVSRLQPGDTLSLVTYSTNDAVVLDGFSVTSDLDKETLMGTLLTLEIDGCTWGSAGIQTAYRLGAEHYQEDCSNQVILITDGDLNFGITKKDGLRRLIEEKKKSNLFLSVIGTGLWNYKDDKLETLSKHGNGTYCVVNNLDDVQESVVNRYLSLTSIIARDVKAQVEFNPRYVRAYRLLGYENRELNFEDFTDDEVISEPYGSGGHGVALYELDLGRGSAETGLKYQMPVIQDIPELCTVKVRYKEPLSDQSAEIVHPVPVGETKTENVLFAYLLYCLAEKLRGSDKLDRHDREFLNVMLTNKLYRPALKRNGEKLKLFLKNFRD